MALLINNDCTSCDACVEVCPNKAISVATPIYVIDPAKCTECVGHFDAPQCVAVCPVNCIPLNPEYPETREALQQKYLRLMAAKQSA